MGSVSGSAGSPSTSGSPSTGGSCTSGGIGFIASRSSVSPETEDGHVEKQLLALEREGAEFFSVQVYRQPLSAGVADHHLLVYWYGVGRGVQIDWGQNGLAFTECSEAPRDGATVAREKACGLSPGTLARQIQGLRDKCYSMLQWNCQHFCQHLFEQACGSARLNRELDRLQLCGVVLTSSMIYQETPGNVGEWVLVFWYDDPTLVRVSDGRHARRGLLLQWCPTGLHVDLSAEEAPGVLVRWRECCVEPERFRRQLREVEGWPFEPSKWSCQRFVEHFFDRVLAQGGSAKLGEHLDDLAARGLEIAGVLDVLTPGSDADLRFGVWRAKVLDELQGEGPVTARQGDAVAAGLDDEKHALVYKYKAAGDRVVHLFLGFTERGVEFAESEEPPGVNFTILRTKPMLFVRLRPEELRRQISEIEGRTYDAVEWNSQHFCAHLFDQVPGKARAAKNDCGAQPRGLCSKAPPQSRGARPVGIAPRMTFKSRP